MGMADDYTISTHDFISPVNYVHNFNMTPPENTCPNLLMYLPIQTSVGKILIWGSAVL